VNGCLSLELCLGSRGPTLLVQERSDRVVNARGRLAVAPKGSPVDHGIRVWITDNASRDH